MGIEVSGKLYLIKDAQQVTERFKKREFVLELGDNPRYPQYVLFQLTGDRTDLLDGFSASDTVRVNFNLRGREWTSPSGEVKFFNSLDVWTIDRLGGSGDEDYDQSVEELQYPGESPGAVDDDIPF